MAAKIIGLTGKMEAGKTTAANHLRERHGYAGSNLTDPFDEMLTPLLRRMKVPDHEILPRLNGTMKNVPIPGYEWLTGRKLKQALGREFRDAISQPIEGGGTDRAFFHDLWIEDNSHLPRIIHEQVRYPFEAALIQRDGGVVYEIFDPNNTRQDDHESEQIGFPVDARISNPKTGLEHLHQTLDALVGEDASAMVQHEGAPEPLAVFDVGIDTALNVHGDEIRSIADRLDAGDEDISETLDEIAADIKGHLGSAAANTAADDQAEYAIEAAERWVTDNVSNSTSDRRVAAAFAFLGADQASNRIGNKA